MDKICALILKLTTHNGSTKREFSMFNILCNIYGNNMCGCGTIIIVNR